MLIKTLPVGMLSTNCYIVTDENTMQCVIIDPGAESNTILDYIESHKLEPVAIFLTHGHFDHRLALEAVLEAYSIPVYLSEKEVDRGGKNEQLKIAYDNNMRFCRDGDEISAGSIRFKVLETPGHSEGSVTLLCTAAGGPGTYTEADALFTGDTLFCGDCGRTDLPGGSRETILESLRRLSELPGDYEVYPGHDESSTLENERLYNLDMKIATGNID